MKEAVKVKKMLKMGITKAYFCRVLSMSAPTLNKRLKDGKFSQLEKDKINIINL